MGLECLLQRHRFDLRTHAGQDAEVERLFALVGRAGDRSEHTALADDEMTCRHGQRVLARTRQHEPAARRKSRHQRRYRFRIANGSDDGLCPAHRVELFGRILLADVDIDMRAQLQCIPGDVLAAPDGCNLEAHLASVW